MRKLQKTIEQLDAEARAKALEEFAKMAPIDYERVRREKAKQLGIRAAALDKEVGELRERLAANGGADGQEDGGQRESQASLLVKFILERCELVHDENGEVYAIDRTTGEIRHTEWRSFKDWVSAAFYEQHALAARAQSFAEALSVLSGLGRYRGQLADIQIRCARVDTGYVIDLGEPGNSRAVIVEASGWRIVDSSPVRFLRPQSLRPLPAPVRGGNLAELWELVNVPESRRMLVLAWTLDSWRPDSDFSVLELFGEQGSAKSLLQQFLARLVDPSVIEKRSTPKNGGEDLYVGAAASWLLAYDNVSHLSADLQDVLCRISTGSTYAGRRLHTNKEESSIRAKRPRASTESLPPSRRRTWLTALCQ
jgi:hypothetical protein